MIYILLTKEKSILQDKIVNYIKQHLKFNNYNYKFIFNKQHIIENDLDIIDEVNDIVLWNPFLAHDNLDIVKQFANSVVILEKPTVLTQKVSKHNPINENTAIFNGFHLVYMEPNNNDITNEEYSLIVHEENYLYTIDILYDKFNENEANLKIDSSYKKPIEEDNNYDKFNNQIIIENE